MNTQKNIAPVLHPEREKTYSITPIITYDSETYHPPEILKAQSTQLLKTVSNHPDKESVVMYLAIDAEWVDRGIGRDFNTWLQTTVSFVYKNRVHLLFFSKLQETHEELIKLPNTVSHLIFHINQIRPLVESYLSDLLPESTKKTRSVTLINKYSPLDYHAYFGTEWLDLVGVGRVEQKRSLRFTPVGFTRDRTYTPNDSSFTYTLRDVSGLNSSGLKVQADAVNVTLHAKDTMDKYKADMLEGYKKHPLLASVYCACDTMATLEIAYAYTPQFKQVADSLDVEWDLTLDNLPHTTGSLVGQVASLFFQQLPTILHKRSILSDYLKNPLLSPDLLQVAWIIALYKHGVIRADLDDRALRKAQALKDKLYQVKSIDDVAELSEADTEELTNLKKLRQYFLSSFEQSSSKTFGVMDSTACFLAMVQGGRINNANPFDYNLKLVVDADELSCYGSALRSLSRAIGLPRIRSYQEKHNEPTPLLTDILDELADNLADGLWVADISTAEPLSFCQDIVFSSLNTSQAKIRRAVTGIEMVLDDDTNEEFPLEGDIKKIPSDFALIRKEIEHGKLTSHTWKLINKVATKRELSELSKKLRCNSISYYDTKLRHTKLDTYIEAVLSDDGRATTDNNNDVVDMRTRKWFDLPLELFIGKMVNERGLLKKKAKTAKDLGEKEALDALQTSYKLFINTFYGVSASVYFDIGDTILANNITSRARVNSWLMEKATRAGMTITDGSFFSVLSIPKIFPGSVLPGLDVFADVRKWAKSDESKNIKRSHTTLGGYSEGEWLDRFKELENAYKLGDEQTVKRFETEWSELYKTNLTSFWEPYGISIEFGTELKFDHTSWGVGYFGKGDYCMNTVRGGWVIKKRGARIKPDELEDPKQAVHPGVRLLHAMAREAYTPQIVELWKNSEYTHTRLIKVPEYAKTIPITPTENPTKLSEFKALDMVVPGSAMTTKREPIKLYNTHRYIETIAEYNRLKKGKTSASGEDLTKYITSKRKFLDVVNGNTTAKGRSTRRKN